MVDSSRPKPAGGSPRLGPEPITEMVVGVYRSPDEFLKEACLSKHPRSLIHGVPEPLHQCISSITSQSLADVAKLRTAALRKWVLRAKEIRQMENPILEPMPHCKEILKSKNMPLFSEMLASVGYKDSALASEICAGFDLLGPIPSSGVLPSKTTVATLTKEDVRQAASLNRKIALDAMSRCGDPEVAKEVYTATIDERDRGWVRGPIPVSQIPEHSILTRRFGVIQSSTGEGGEQIRKVRPIDDYTQSLANLTASSCETIAPHGVDAIMAGLLLRLRLSRLTGRRPSLKLRTIDLRKAYKQLPLSLEALGDAYIRIHNPDTHQAEVYQTLVLPFGARSAVQAFCRTSAALWHLGSTILWLPWSVYFDDYVLSGEAEECRHLDFIQAGFFQLVGWETSSEKDSGFSFTARALGVEICLGEAHLGLLSVQNTESRKRELAAAITHALDAKGAPSKDFECLRGRMLFAEGQIFGRRANQSMKILSAACRNAGYVKVTPELELSLTFLRDRVVSAPPRLLRACDRSCFHLFTDASLDDAAGGLGCILHASSGLCLRWIAEEVSAAVVSAAKDPLKDGFIYELEACAAVIGVTQLCRGIKDSDIIVYIDNEAALSAMIRCKSSSLVVASLLRDLCDFEDVSGNHLWFERIPSKSNPADAPSRSVFDHLPKAFRQRFDAAAHLLEKAKDV